MASITRQPNGRRTIQFVGSDGRRRSVRLGKASQRVAEAVKIRIEHLNAASIHGHAIDDETARMVKKNDVVISTQLVVYRALKDLPGISETNLEKLDVVLAGQENLIRVPKILNRQRRLLDLQPVVPQQRDDPLPRDAIDLWNGHPCRGGVRSTTSSA